MIAILKAANVSLLCFDEAQHLRKEWWKALTYLNEHLKPEQTLALTAAPPYDADYGEWKRYQDLCGEIEFGLRLFCRTIFISHIRNLRILYIFAFDNGIT